MGKLESGTRVYGTFTSDTSIGYTPGIGIAKSVIQLGSRTTPVIINAPTGSITMYTDSASSTANKFTVVNSYVAANDVIIIHPLSGIHSDNYYFFSIRKVTTGSFDVNFFSPKGSANDTPVLQFALIKGAAN